MDYQARLTALKAGHGTEDLFRVLVDHLYETGNLGVALDALEAAVAPAAPPAATPKPKTTMQAVFTVPADTDVGPPAFHAGDYAYDPQHPNRGVPEEHWDKESQFPLIVDYDPETGYAEWWPPMMCGMPPSTAPWSHPTAANLPRMEMYALVEAALREIY